MNISIHLGWWLIPAAITVFVWAWLAKYCARRKPGGDYDFGGDVILLMVAAIAVTALVWCLYFAACLIFATKGTS